MANLATKDFQSIVRDCVAAIQAQSTQLLNLTVGSVLRAIVEAHAAVVLWLQGLVAYVLSRTRFSTSIGEDADSWGADFAFTRLAAVSATGEVTFGRFTTTAESVVPFGAVVQSGDGTQKFTVNNDPSGTGYDATKGGYVLGIGVTSRTVGVTGITPGSGSNVLANTITSIGQGIPGIDTVTNADAFLNGLDAESDAAYKARFVQYIASLSKATKTAIQAAINGVQQGLQSTITENETYDGDYDPGFFYVVVDDGSGVPSGGLLDAIGAAIESTRALGIRFAVFAPVVVDADVDMIITSAPGFDNAVVVGAVGDALEEFLDTLPLGAGLPYTQLSAIAYGVAGVVNVSGVLLNGTTADIPADDKKVIRAGEVDVG